MELKDHIRGIPDFPKPGILFYDISTLIAHADAWRVTMDRLAKAVSQYQPDVLAGIESRGFLVAAPLALKLGLGFVMVRKEGKLPGATVSHQYDLEYGKTQTKDSILFVGNDGNRDSELFLKIVNNLKDINFTAITNIENLLNAKRPNLNVVKGSFGSSNLSDTELKQYYLSSKLVILPLRESSQPSGQSVTLQSLSCGTQVIISDTEGFWDRNNFKNNKNIYFVKENNYKSWSNRINQV